MVIYPNILRIVIGSNPAIARTTCCNYHHSAFALAPADNGTKSLFRNL